MKKLLVLLMTTAFANAQDIYESKHSEYYQYNYGISQYESIEKVWTNTRFSYTREIFEIELDSGKIIKMWWAYEETTSHGWECYYTEGDHFKICLNLAANELTIFTGSIDNMFRRAWTLSHIEKIN
jgi:NAD-dependent SIR2 family protein deacetylase